VDLAAAVTSREMESSFERRSSLVSASFCLTKICDDHFEARREKEGATQRTQEKEKSNEAQESYNGWKLTHSTDLTI
jgi:hypothetical protein